MTDQRPIFLATDTGATAVLRAARRRRWRQLAVALSVSGVVAGGSVAVVAHQGRTSTDRLASSTPPTANTVTMSPRRPRATPPTSPPALAPSPGVAGGHASAGAPRPAPAPAGSAAPSSSPPHTHWAAPNRVSPIRRSWGTLASTDVCDDDTTEAGTGWCVRYLGPATATRGRAVTVRAEICRRAAFNPATLHFTSTREIDLEVGHQRSNGSEAKDWQAGEGVSYRSPGPTVTVDPGRCLIWSSAWDTRDEQGFVVPPGTYDVNFALDADTPLGTYAQINVSD